MAYWTYNLKQAQELKLAAPRNKWRDALAERRASAPPHVLARVESDDRGRLAEILSSVGGDAGVGLPSGGADGVEANAGAGAAGPTRGAATIGGTIADRADGGGGGAHATAGPPVQPGLPLLGDEWAGGEGQGTQATPPAVAAAPSPTARAFPASIERDFATPAASPAAEPPSVEPLGESRSSPDRHPVP
jgi:pyruvate/2-oxoglutarate dehydrogenase complex dihydrolipoamide acyltransferase (E2) component